MHGGRAAVVANVKDRLGVGLYTPAEAARLVRTRSEAITRWLYGSAKGEAVIAPKLGADERIVTFSEVIQSLAIRTARQRKVPLPKIREAIKQATDDYGIADPLAHKHTLYYYDGSIIIRLDTALVGLTGKDRGQRMMPPIVEPFMDEIDWTGERGLALEWTPKRSPNYSIVLNPRFRFGQPIVQPGGFLVDALADAVESEGGVEEAAAAFEVKPEAVLLVLKYRDDLAGIVS